MTTIIAIGNSGTGKSTILNLLAGEAMFQSGVSQVHKGIPTFHEKENYRGKFLDTPGLYAVQHKVAHAQDRAAHREAAGKALSGMLQRGGACKFLFLVRECCGRVPEEDVAALRLVLAAAPEMSKSYGIIVNRVSESLLQELENPDKMRDFYFSLYCQIETKRRCPMSNVFFLKELPELKSAGKLDTLELDCLDQFKRWIYVDAPIVDMTPNNAGDVKGGQFEATVAQLKQLRAEAAQNTPETRALQNTLLGQMYKTEELKMASLERYQDDVILSHRRATASLNARIAELNGKLKYLYRRQDERRITARKKAAVSAAEKIGLFHLLKDSFKLTRVHGTPARSPDSLAQAQDGDKCTALMAQKRQYKLEIEQREHQDAMRNNNSSSQLTDMLSSVDGIEEEGWLNCQLNLLSNQDSDW